MIRAIFFDLDNTLYNQDLYFSLAYTEIAKYLENYFSYPSAFIFSNLMALLKEKGSMYSNLFDDLLAIIGSQDKSMIGMLRKIFHNASIDTLVLYEDADLVLPRLAQRFKLGIITNGHKEMQRRKVCALGLNKFLQYQIYTDEIGYPKPSLKCYEYAIEMAKVIPQESIYVGDNPYVDFAGAKSIGMHTIRLLRGEFISIKHAGNFIDREIRDFYELEGLISNLN